MTGSDLGTARAQRESVTEALAFENITTSCNELCTVWTFTFHDVVVARYRPLARKINLAGEELSCTSPAHARKLLLAAKDSGRLYVPLLRCKDAPQLKKMGGLSVWQEPHAWLFFRRRTCVGVYLPRRGEYKDMLAHVTHVCKAHDRAWQLAHKGKK